MVRPKKSHFKKQKGRRSIDFKKTRHKVGRKLPPPKNSTNTQIKSKTLILPEQSVSSERRGLAVSSKGLALRELLHQSSHHNPKIRKFALFGIKKLLHNNPSEGKIHKHAIIEKLRVHVCDPDKVVRETLYHLLKIYIFPAAASKEDSSIISLMMPYVLNAMSHLVLDIRISALKFFDLIVTCYPSSFFANAERVIENYRDILQNTQVYVENRSKIKTLIRGLARCLCLLLLPEKQVMKKTGLHSYEHDDTRKRNNSVSSISIIVKVQELLPILVHCFQEFAPLDNNSVSVADDTMSFECTLGILECVKLAVCNLACEIDLPHTYFGEFVFPKPSQSYGLKVKDTLLALEKLWQCFPISSIDESSEKDEERCFSLNTRITEICLHVVNGMHQGKILKEKFLTFIEKCLHGQAKSSLQDKHLASVVQLIPGMLTYLNENWRICLLHAFTLTFQDCKVESRLNLACLSVVEKMLLLDSFRVDTLDYQASWMQKLLGSLIQVEDRNFSLSKAILRLVLKVGQQRSHQNPSFEYQYNNLQTVLRVFYCTIYDDGNINYGPFVKLPKDCQELALCCLYYFSNLDSHLLQSLTYCSSYEGMERDILMRMIDVLQSSYKAGNVNTADYVSLLLTLVARFKVHHGKQSNSGVDDLMVTEEKKASIDHINRDDLSQGLDLKLNIDTGTSWAEHTSPSNRNNHEIFIVNRAYPESSAANV